MAKLSEYYERRPKLSLREEGVEELKTEILNFTGAGVTVSGENVDILGIGALPGSAKGDLLVFDGASHVALPVGTNGQALTVDASSATGLKWDFFEVTGGGGGGISFGSDIILGYGFTSLTFGALSKVGLKTGKIIVFSPGSAIAGSQGLKPNYSFGGTELV